MRRCGAMVDRLTTTPNEPLPSQRRAPAAVCDAAAEGVLTASWPSPTPAVPSVSGNYAAPRRSAPMTDRTHKDISRFSRNQLASESDQREQKILSISCRLELECTAHFCRVSLQQNVRIAKFMRNCVHRLPRLLSS